MFENLEETLRRQDIVCIQPIKINLSCLKCLPAHLIKSELAENLL